MNSQVQRYHRLDIQTAVDSASPHQLIDLMFQGVKDRLHQAELSITRNDMPAKARAINACVDIITGLQASLDHEQGGEIADNLSALYDYMQRRLFRASTDNDVAILSEVEDLVNTLKSAWSAINPDGHASAG